MTAAPPTLLEVKAKARQMSQMLRAQGHSDVGHVTCLHELSVQAGYKNWQMYRAALIRTASRRTA